MKYILLSAAVFIVLAIIFLSSFLGPNDLADCQGKPGPNGVCQAVDAIVVVSGGDTEARTTEGIKMYQNGWAPLIVFSGAARDKTGPSNAEVMRRQAIAEGIPEHAIITEELSRTTAENAEQTRTFIRQLGIERVMVVTSAYHQRRAGHEFEKQAGNVEVVNHPVARDRQWSEYWWTTPIGWYLALSETTKLMVFYAGSAR